MKPESYIPLHRSTSKEIASLLQATLVTHVGPKPRVDALFIHGSPANRLDIDEALLSMSATLLKNRGTDYLVINGLSDSVCKANNLAYPGSDTWKSILYNLGVEDSKILTIPPSLHTAAESQKFLILAKDRGWKSVSITSFPHHLLRCFAQIIYFIDQDGSDLKVYPRTMDSAPWFSETVKTTLDGGIITGNLLDHITEEFNSLYKYGNQNVPLKEGRLAYTPNALPADIIDYCLKRDS